MINYNTLFLFVVYFKDIDIVKDLATIVLDKRFVIDVGYYLKFR